MTTAITTNITSSVLGVDLNNYSSTALFTKGTAVIGTNGSLWEYVNTLSAISTYNVVAINVSNDASNLTSTLAQTENRLGVAQISIAVSTYGWVQRQGKMLVNLATNCDNNVLLFTTSTPGVLDDATISGGLVLGLMSQTTISTATAITCIAAAPLQVGWFSNPA